MEPAIRHKIYTQVTFIANYIFFLCVMYYTQYTDIVDRLYLYRWDESLYRQFNQGTLYIQEHKIDILFYVTARPSSPKMTAFIYLRQVVE